MKLIAFLLASTEATQLASEASWNNGQYVPWTPPANMNTGAYNWTPPANQNTGAYNPPANQNTGAYNWTPPADQNTDAEVTADPVETLVAFDDIWDDSTTTGTVTANTPETPTGGEWDPSTIEIPTSGEDSTPTAEELDMLNSFVDTNWQNEMPWMNSDSNADMYADQYDADNESDPDDDSFIDTNWQNEMPWLNTPDVEPTTDDFEEMFDQIDTRNDWDRVTEADSDLCLDTDNGITDDYGDGCDEYAENLDWCGLWDTDDFQSNDMCCACKDYEQVNPYGEDMEFCEDNMDVEDVYGDDCGEYWGNEHWCGLYDFYGEGQFSAFHAFTDCCACKAMTGPEYLDQLDNIEENWGMNNPDDY